MPVDGLSEHPHARAVLGAALPPEGSPSHAYLFHGPAGAGKRETARAFAAVLLAEGAPDPENARRRVLSGVHPDLTWVRPSGAAEMLVADIEEPVVAAVSHTPFESSRRVFVIERVETMGDATANRMLKTIEEPPSFAHIILLSDRLGEVLPTIRSRCQLVRFEAPGADALAQRLQRQGVPPEPAEACARLALGDGERALRLSLGDGPALRHGAELYARAAVHGRTEERPWAALLSRAGERGSAASAEVEARLAEQLPFLPQKEQGRAKREAGDAAKRSGRRARTDALDEALLLVALWFRDVAVVADGAPEHAHALDRLAVLGEDAARVGGSARAREAVTAVEETRAALRLVNATEELALEALAYRLERELS